MLFSDLMKAQLPAELTAEVQYLLDLKVNSPELKEISRIEIIHEYLEDSIEIIKEKAKSIPDKNDAEWGELNKLFLEALQHSY